MITKIAHQGMAQFKKIAVRNTINTCHQLLLKSFKPNMSTFKDQKPIDNKKLEAYARLCRYDKPIGAMLLFWPTAWGVCMGSLGFPSPYLLALFFMGSWTSRSAGCIVNDYFDREIDRKVERTKMRPLASGQVTTSEAAALLFANLCGGLFVLFHLPKSALVFTGSIVLVAAAYPLAKRYTNYPQLILGICFNSGIVIGALTAGQIINYPSIFSVYAAGICWTMIYDTVYAYQDVEDDIKIGVKSTAVHWKNKNPKKIMQRWGWAMVIFHGCLPLFDIQYTFPAVFMIALDFLLIKQIQKLNLQSREMCSNFFKRNNQYGLGIFLCLFFLNIIRFLDKQEKEK